MTKKQQTVVQIYNTLNGGDFDEPEVREERDEVLKKLNELYINIDSLQHEYDANVALLGGLRGKYESIGSEKAVWIERLAHILFMSDSTWSTDEPEETPASPANPDTNTTAMENAARLAEEIDSEFNCGETPTIVLSRYEVNVLYVTKRNCPDPERNKPIYWHHPTTGKAIVEVVGVQMGEFHVPVETRVIFKRTFRTPLEPLDSILVIS
jgi:hypothetical protein